MKSYYLATKLENIDLASIVIDRLQGKCTYNWTKHGPVWMKGEGVIRDTIAAEVHGVTTADILVMLLPGGRGAHCELGAALALNIPVLLYAPDELFFTINEKLGCFYYHPAVKMRITDIELLVSEANRRLTK